MTTSSKVHNHRHLTEDRSYATSKRQPYTEQDSVDAMNWCYDSITGTVYHIEGYDASSIRAARVISLSNDDYFQEVLIPLARIAHSCSEVNQTCLQNHSADRPLRKACMPQDTSHLGAWTPKAERPAVHDAPRAEVLDQVPRSKAQPCGDCISIVWEILFGFQDGDRYVKGVIPVLNRFGGKNSGKRQSLAELRKTINNVVIDQHRARQVSSGLPAKPTAAVSSLRLADPATERIVRDYFTARLTSGCAHHQGIESAAQDLLARSPGGTIKDARSAASTAITQARKEAGEERWRTTITDAIITRAAAGAFHLDHCLHADNDDDNASSGYGLLDSRATAIIGAEPVKDPTVSPRRQNSSHTADKELRSEFVQTLRSALANPANHGRSRLEVAITVIETLALSSSTTTLMSGPFQEQYEGDNAGERVRELLRTNPEALATLRALIKDCDREENRRRRSWRA